MKLTHRGEYALLALVYLARHAVDRRVPADEISREQKIPRGFLTQIFIMLARARFVIGTKGPGGGYRLARPAAEITLAEIVRVLEGALAATPAASKYFYEPSPIEQEPALLDLFKRVREVVAQQLEKTTLADVARSRARQARR